MKRHKLLLAALVLLIAAASASGSKPPLAEPEAALALMKRKATP